MYHYAKFYAFIRKWTIDVIFHWLYTYFVCCLQADTPCDVLSIKHRLPRPGVPRPTCTDNFL